MNLANAQKVSILFLGNSLTYTHDLPAQLQQLAKAHGMELTTECLCYPNYGLEDHWMDGDIPEFLESESFDFVVFQQGPSSQQYGKESLLEYGGKIADLSRKSNAKPVYFMVWPSLLYYYTFDGVIQNHRTAASENNSLLANVGEVWRKMHEGKGNAGLYGQDGFHPSPKGTALAAMILFQSLLGQLDEEQIPEKMKKKFTTAELKIILNSRVVLY